MNPASSELPLITVEEMEMHLSLVNRSVIDSYNNADFRVDRHKYRLRWKR